MREMRNLGFGKTCLEGVVLSELEATVGEMRKSPEVHPNEVFKTPVLNVLWWLVAGKQFARSDPQFERLLRIMDKIMRNMYGPLAPVDLFPPLKHLAPEWSAYEEVYFPLFEMHKFLREEVNSIRKCKQDCFIRTYAAEVDRFKESGEITEFTDDSLVMICLDLFLAGGESSANTLSFCLLYMVLHPEVQAKVQDELDAVLGRDNLATLADRQRLPYVDATLNEVMRINSIAPVNVPRRATADFEINGYTVPKNSLVFTSLWSVQHDKEHWGDPENFRPERFLDGNGSFVKNPYMTQFGGGKRQCVGEALVQQTLFLFFTGLMARFRFALPDGAPQPSTDTIPGFTVTPKPFSVLALPRVQ